MLCEPQHGSVELLQKPQDGLLTVVLRVVLCVLLSELQHERLELVHGLQDGLLCVLLCEQPQQEPVELVHGLQVGQEIDRDVETAGEEVETVDESATGKVVQDVVDLCDFVIVEQLHPRARVRSSKRSLRSGHMCLVVMGSKRFEAGTHVALVAHQPQP